MSDSLPALNGQTGVVRTDRGLTIAGTRITLYAVMDYLKAQWPHHLIQSWLDLTSAQFKSALDYIDTHPDQVEQEYRWVVEHAHAAREYWEARQQAQQVGSATSTQTKEQVEIRVRLKQWKDALQLP